MIFDFNPRTPCGVRRGIIQRHNQRILFQSTHPLRGATSNKHNITTDQSDFNPRTPCGVRLGVSRVSVGGVGFQSTHPLRGATFPDCGLLQLFRISIHAPLAGCDRSTRH